MFSILEFRFNLIEWYISFNSCFFFHCRSQIWTAKHSKRRKYGQQNILRS